jgi:predicted dehydrogenase
MLWSTAPFPEKDDDFQVYFIAGYHHTHAPIAEYVLKKGAIAVVEKPVVVDYEQLSFLSAALSAHNGKIYSCYHKRYSQFNLYAKADLGGLPTDPINYHCLVHEVPLPEKHWYRWPNSHSRIISNGCHWIDHFLYLNHYAKPVYIDGYVSADETYNCTIQLENGAFFSMVLTDKGSSRIGVQDYIELRRGKVTVTMVNGIHYRAENNDQVIRKATVKKLHTYISMYRAIAQDLTQGLLADSLESLLINNQVMLDLEAKLLAQRGEKLLVIT